MWRMNIMNFLKKISSIKIGIIISFIITVIFIVLIIVTVIKKNVVYKFLVNVQDYYLTTKEDYLTLMVYSNQDDNYYLNVDTITDALIYSKDETLCSTVEVRKIEKSAEVKRYKDETYYGYILELKMPFKNSEYARYLDVSIKFTYPSFEVIKLNLGNLIIYENYPTKNIHLQHLKGVVNEINSKSYLVGVAFTITSKCDMVVKNIVSLNPNISFQNDNFVILDSLDFDNYQDISTLLDFKYEVTYKDEYGLDLKLGQDEECSILIPISYETLNFVNTLAFNIEYEVNGIKYTETISPFKYFSNFSGALEEVVYDPN